MAPFLFSSRPSVPSSMPRFGSRAAPPADDVPPPHDERTTIESSASMVVRPGRPERGDPPPAADDVQSSSASVVAASSLVLRDDDDAFSGVCCACRETNRTVTNAPSMNFVLRSSLSRSRDRSDSAALVRRLLHSWNDDGTAASSSASSGGCTCRLPRSSSRHDGPMSRLDGESDIKYRRK